MSDVKTKAYQEGWDAYWQKSEQDANPYVDPELYEEWALGWLAAQNADKNGL